MSLYFIESANGTFSAPLMYQRGQKISLEPGQRAHFVQTTRDIPEGVTVVTTFPAPRFSEPTNTGDTHGQP